MKRYATGLAVMLAMALATTPALAKGVFDGTWKGDVKASKPAEKPSIILLQAGTFSCTTCKPALKFPADGTFHPIVGNPYYDEASVAVVDATTVKRAFRKSGKTVAEATVTLAADGQSSSSAFVDRTAPSGVEVTGTTVNARVAPAPAGAHALSGAWRETTDTQVSDTGLVFTFAQDGKTMAFSTPTGISYAATIDGPPATVTGDPGWTKVALKQTGPTTLFETDYEGDTPIGTYSMSLSPDGTTMTTAVNDLKHGKTSTMVAHRQ
ncbi:hypothetical protein [Sphingomonas sp. Ant20]|uniref:hypothetical protein n=1 Tax=Sphingomonas sp. Ant20 TaxID=104605 RepID=UPI00068D4395|nr:hypothetical protein [Sphingomonas sp. Ant20]